MHSTSSGDGGAQSKGELEQRAELLDLVREAILVRDIETSSILYWSKGAQELYGFSGEEALGRVSHELLQTRFPQPLSEITRIMLQTGQWDGELVQRGRGGSEIVVESRWTLQRERDGTPAAFLEANRDITARNQAELALAASEQRFRRMIERAPVGIAISRPDGTFESVNEAFAAILGYAVEELVGQPFINVIPRESREAIRTLRAEHVAASSEFVVEMEMTARDGRPIAVLSHSLSLEPENPGHRLTFLLDITQQRRADEARRIVEEQRVQQEMTTRTIRAQEEERKRIARELHDETAQALSTILINLDVLEPYVAEASDVVKRGLQRVRTLTRRALEETRGLAQDLRPTIVDDVGLVGAIRWLAQQLEETYGVPVSVVVADAAQTRLPPEVEIALFRIAQEALTNIGKYARARQVSVRLDIEEPIITLTIEDDGVGFDLEDVRSRREHGRLGLFGMSERAAILAGSLSIETAPGVGTKVMASLPLRTMSAEPSVPQTPTQQERSSQLGTRVVLVDDHAVMRQGLRMVIDAEPGLRVVGEAADGREALDVVEQLRPDIVIMDISMPNLNGLEATRHIRQRFPATKVVILTMHETGEYVGQIVRVGASGGVLKRSAAIELTQAIRAATSGDTYFSPSLTRMLVDEYRVHLPDEQGTQATLTDREREVLQLVAEGRSNKEIAGLLTISLNTVRVHRANIMSKLDAHDRTELVRHALRLGVIAPE